ncbi:YDG domain-containing protein [Candidatus Avoscillospira sp. LCP25S3_F1]|uniref:YDG domain-containing protein n=1 Tax=Candidatus Avoscillospira sp. LCP25S3_F1 TaxID=3438825 RepID=UPI003F9038F9
MKKKAISILLTLALCLSLLPATALAAGSVSYLDANGNAQTCDSYTEAKSSEDRPNSKDATWGTDGADTWYVVNGAVTIYGVLNLKGNVHLILTDGCTLAVKFFLFGQNNCNLTIYGQNAGTGKLIATGGGEVNYPYGIRIDNGGSLTINGGVIEASAANSKDAAGIKATYGTVTINGGSVTAGSANDGAGIYVKTLNINGGTVTATGTGSGVGIKGSAASSITITGGNVTATAASGAGISGGTITISGSTEVTANGAGSGAGIDAISASNSKGSVNIEDSAKVTAKAGASGGAGISGGEISISGSTEVEATGGENGAGIGGGQEGSGGEITISGGTVEATGGGRGAGIGGGNVGSGGKITISGGTVTATGGIYAAGIGGGKSGSSGTIDISGGKVTATGGGQFGAGIGGGQQGSGESITISGSGAVTATGGDSAAGIGGGWGGDGGTITINGGKVTANGSGTANGGAGIGGGSNASGGEITITGGTVTANGGENSAGIGGGSNASGGEITITGGTVTANGGTSSHRTGAGIGGSGGSFATDGSGKAVIYANSISDQSGKASWSGIIFEGSNGGVYGSQSLSSTFTVKSGENLLIDKNATLNAGSNLTNNGNVYVDGTLTGAVGGNVYYRLFLTNCTAAGTTEYKSNSYAKQGTAVTLTPNTPPDGQRFDHWNAPAGLTINADNKFTMPSKAVDISAAYIQAVQITTQPTAQTVTYGADVTLSIAAQNPSGNATGITYQWYKDSSALPGETSNTLTLTKPNAGTYQYHCAVTYDGITINSGSATVTVNKAAGSVTITGNPGKTYDGQPAVLTESGYTVTGDGAVTVEYTKQGENSYSTAAPTNAGDYTVKVTQAVGTNYAEASSTKDFTISPRPVTVSGITANGKTYDGNTEATLIYSGVTLAGKLDGDTLTVTATGTFTDKNAADGKTVNITNLTLGGASKDNYTLAAEGQQSTTTASISPKQVTVTIQPKSSAYGAAIAELTATDNGIVPGDTGVYTLSTTATSASPVGTYDITGTSNSTNYDLTFTGSDGAYTITAASLSPSVTLDGWTYGDTPKGPVVTGNTENGEVTYLYKVWSASDETYSPTVPTEAGKYSVKATIAATANYQQDVVYDDFTIVPKVLTVTGLTATDRVYDGTTNVTLTGGELSGIVAGDEGRVTAAMPTTGTIANADAGNGKLVTYATIDLTGDKSENYALRRPEVTVNISKADPNVGEVSYSGDTIYTSTPLNSITLSKTGATDGTLKLTDNQTLTAGTADYGWTFTPTDSTNYKTVIGTISLTVEGDTLSSISASGTPAKTSYQYGESFETDGLTVTATYVSGTTRDVTAEVTFGALAVGDTSIELAYQGKTCTISGLTVDKADAPMLADISVKQKYTTTSGEKDIGAAGMPDKAGVLTYAKGTETTTGTVTVTSWDVDSTGKVTYTLSGGTVNDTVTLPIKITSTNYADSTVNVVITLTDKETPTATANDITVTYTGSAVPDSAITGTASVEGSWSFKNAVPVNVADSSDSVTVVFTPADTNTYETVEDIIKVTINKATPTGTPAYTAITSDGKTLADAALAIGTITPTGGSIVWDVAADTAVTANTAYNWTYTPTDGDNYNNLTGSITPYVVSYSGGGSSSNTTTKTEKNEDGSTTTTVTDKTTGTVTETTKNTDGSTTVVETKKDGTVTETNKAADGTTGTVVTDKNGDVTEVKSSVSDKAATEAAKSGDAVTLPVEVPTAKNTGDAPAVDVTVPKSAGSVKVEIPVETVTPGTVAVIVNADGTEEIVKTSIPTENGVALTLAGSATVKIVDNAKVFVDIHPVNHWAKDAVDFASARGITGGTSDSSFSPNASCTRAQIVTFLWRAAGSPEPENLSDFSDVPADAYYAKAVAWALENGITGGTGNGMFSPDATCTRSQSVTFLYRAAGSPTASDGIAFGDVTAESYYADAVAWAAQNGITGGIGSGLFGPANECSRAQIVTFLYRFMVK